MNTENNEFENFTDSFEFAHLMNKKMLDVSKKKMYLEVGKVIGYILIALLYLSATIFFALQAAIAEAILFGITLAIWCVVAILNIPIARQAVLEYETCRRFIDWNDSI